jgi:tripartite-type tricarboxylate transporter receptor subunit TctC
MTILRRRALFAGASLLAAPALVPAIARAQSAADLSKDWPKGQVKIIVPFPPGGSTDPVARIIQAKLIDQTGWNVLIDNKPGGTGAVGSAVAAKSAPDGQTWMITFDSHILNPAFASNLPYKDSDLINVMEIGQTPQVIVAHPDRPYKSFAEAVEDAKKRPGKVSMGVLGASQGLVLATLIKKENDVDLNLIAMGSLTSLSPHIMAKKVRAIAVTGQTRTPALPDTPTLAEQKIKAFPSYSWWGVYAPAGTPRPIVDKMHEAITKAVRSPDVTQKFVEQFNMEILTSTPEKFAAYQKSEQERWFKVIKDNDIKGD